MQHTGHRLDDQDEYRMNKNFNILAFQFSIFANAQTVGIYNHLTQFSMYAVTILWLKHQICRYKVATITCIVCYLSLCSKEDTFCISFVHDLAGIHKINNIWKQTYKRTLQLCKQMNILMSQHFFMP